MLDTECRRLELNTSFTQLFDDGLPYPSSVMMISAHSLTVMLHNDTRDTDPCGVVKIGSVDVARYDWGRKAYMHMAVNNIDLFTDVTDHLLEEMSRAHIGPAARWSRYGTKSINTDHSL